MRKLFSQCVFLLSLSTAILFANSVYAADDWAYDLIPQRASVVLEIRRPEIFFNDTRRLIASIDKNTLTEFNAMLSQAGLPADDMQKLAKAGVDGQAGFAGFLLRKKSGDFELGFILKVKDPEKLRDFFAKFGFGKIKIPKDLGAYADKISFVMGVENTAENEPSAKKRKPKMDSFLIVLKDGRALIANKTQIVNSALKKESGAHFMQSKPYRNLRNEFAESMIALYINPDQALKDASDSMAEIGLNGDVSGKFAGFYNAIGMQLVYKKNLSVDLVAGLSEKHPLHKGWVAWGKNDWDGDLRFLPANPLVLLTLNLDLQKFLAFLRNVDPEFDKNYQAKIKAQAPAGEINFEKEVAPFLSGNFAAGGYDFDMANENIRDYFAAIGFKKPADATRILERVRKMNPLEKYESANLPGINAYYKIEADGTKALLAAHGKFIVVTGNLARYQQFAQNAKTGQTSIMGLAQNQPGEIAGFYLNFAQLLGENQSLSPELTVFKELVKQWKGVRFSVRKSAAFDRLRLDFEMK